MLTLVEQDAEVVVLDAYRDRRNRLRPVVERPVWVEPDGGDAA